MPAAPLPAVDENTAVIPEEKWPDLPIYPLLRSTATTGTDENPAPENKYQVDEVVLNNQSRRMRSYETHYIDHPRFGILIRFVPLDTNTLQPIPPQK
jgi:hypothetical protein